MKVKIKGHCIKGFENIPIFCPFCYRIVGIKVRWSEGDVRIFVEGNEEELEKYKTANEEGYIQCPYCGADVVVK